MRQATAAYRSPRASSGRGSPGSAGTSILGRESPPSPLIVITSVRIVTD
jgi:hypothetical protein